MENQEIFMRYKIYQEYINPHLKSTYLRFKKGIYKLILCFKFFLNFHGSKSIVSVGTKLSYFFLT